jgi:hypothetical protein
MKRAVSRYMNTVSSSTLAAATGRWRSEDRRFTVSPKRLDRKWLIKRLQGLLPAFAVSVA